jgi:site-specific DNA-methyltransferase (adenine-specific)
MILTILTGDNIELLKQYPDNYFDSVVTDCPYGLGKEPNALKLLQDWIDHGYHEIKGKGFMGKSWDSFVPQPLFWKEVFRVLKPGGYVLAFFGTRTYDWGTMAIRLAGFEIRDMICWHYGSGFPKSLDVSKAIDKHLGAERTKIKTPHTPKSTKGKGFSNELAERPWMNKARKNGYHEHDSTEAATEAAGWGTALKPATENICVARKPLIGTVAENVLKYGTGGINIDGCRTDIDADEDENFKARIGKTFHGKEGGLFGGIGKFNGDYFNSAGRFPANVIFDPFMADVLDEQTGITKSTGGNGSKFNSASRNTYSNKSLHNQVKEGEFGLGFGDSGGSSRFFYCAKASQDERNLGCENLETRTGGMISNTSGQHLTRREDDYVPAQVSNFHPTVKPIALMRYLQRLVTPKGGICLDPFAGSGTSGCSASFEDIGEIILMEMDETYIPIIEARTKYWSIERNRINYLDKIKKQKQEVVENQFKLAL